MSFCTIPSLLIQHPSSFAVLAILTNNALGRASEYPHHFRAWKVSDRRLTKAKLNEIAVALERRPTAEISTSKVSLKRGACEAKLDVRQVKRHLANNTSSSKPEIMQSGWYVLFSFKLLLVTDINKAILLDLTICCVCINITQESRRRLSLWDTVSNTRLSRDQ